MNSSHPATMRAAVMHKPGDIRLEDKPKPQVRAGHALVKVAVCGVCGSDIPRMLQKGAHVMPLICGHEFAGYVEALGEGVEGHAIGDLVAVPPLLPCGICDQCARGFPSRCTDYDYFGSRRDGAYAEYVNVPAANLFTCPEGMDPAAAAMTDPAAVALHAIWKARFTLGNVGAVVGCGPIGLFAIQWMKLLGAKDIIGVDIDPRKLAMAREAGATHTRLVSEPMDDLPKCHLIIEAAGHPTAINQAIRMAAPGGSVVCIGIPAGDIVVESVTFSHLLRQEVTLAGAWNSFGTPFPGEEWVVSLAKLASGELKWKFMVTHDLPLEDLGTMFENFAQKKESAAKVLFRPAGPGVQRGVASGRAANTQE
ncbi:galactitol-1-phosphate 5-dehydrogenase [Verminephrobacter eiseniae]|uniref:galactitol-1-phosphate 5-dehydrogenase n=1 Tax=Verminephrobacter eiseniae TaxID=364317 RepID=UPI00223825C5|nr:galactitol-1-phosphate 5-dehydrogenase [Verminephrobacter eiseniae]MCW5237307.1 galactitol-1-phosphate 5-dehydrogenase [Verminephrobacter eiseniae]